MGQQAIFLSDDKPQDLEAYTIDSNHGYLPKASPQSSFTESNPRALPSPVIAFVKWAFICTLVVLAMTFTLNLFEPSSSKAR